MKPDTQYNPPKARAAHASIVLSPLGSLEEFESPELRVWLADWLASFWQPLFASSPSRLDGRALSKALPTICGTLQLLRRYAASLSTGEQFRVVHGIGVIHGLNTDGEMVRIELEQFFRQAGHLPANAAAFKASLWFNAGAVRQLIAEQAAMDLPRRFYPGPRKRRSRNGTPTEDEICQANLRLAFQTVCTAFIAEDVQHGPLVVTAAVQEKLSNGAGITREDLLVVLKADAEAREHRTAPTPQQQLRRAALEFLGQVKVENRPGQEPGRLSAPKFDGPLKHRSESLARFVEQATCLVRRKGARLTAETRREFVENFLQVGDARGRVATARNAEMVQQLDMLFLSLLRLPEVRGALVRLVTEGTRQRLKNALTALFRHLRDSLTPPIEDTTGDVYVLGAPHLRERKRQAGRDYSPRTVEVELVKERVGAFRKAQGLSLPGAKADASKQDAEKGQSFDAIFRQVKHKHRSWYSAT